MYESDFQSNLIKTLKKMFPGCIVTKNDPHSLQGVPDLNIWYGDTWATLECKRSRHEHHQPNQDYYVELMNQMSFSAFVYPENEGEVLRSLQKYFNSKRRNK